MCCVQLYLFLVNSNIRDNIIIVESSSIGLRSEAVNVYVVTCCLYNSAVHTHTHTLHTQSHITHNQQTFLSATLHHSTSSPILLYCVLNM